MKLGLNFEPRSRNRTVEIGRAKWPYRPSPRKLWAHLQRKFIGSITEFNLPAILIRFLFLFGLLVHQRSEQMVSASIGLKIHTDLLITSVLRFEDHATEELTSYRSVDGLVTSVCAADHVTEDFLM